MPKQNRVGLTIFNDQIQKLIAPGLVEEVKNQIETYIDDLQANSDTALYDTLIQTIDTLIATRTGDGEDRIRAIVVLSDGQDTASIASLNDVLTNIREARSGRNPILIIPVAYGSRRGHRRPEQHRPGVRHQGAVRRSEGYRKAAGDHQQLLLKRKRE